MSEITIEEGYWERLKPYQENVQIHSPEINKQKYLLKNSKRENFDLQDTVKRFEHLLSISTLFKHFIENRAKNDEKFKLVLDTLNENEKVRIDVSKKHEDARRRKSEREEDAELLKEEEEDEDESEGIEFQFRESPGYINGSLRSYQVQGLNWLVSLHKNNLAGILADEMGLGKTLQTISFLGYLRYVENKTGPFLVIAPKSTLNNWLREINKWTPEVNAFILQGDKEERADIVQKKLLSCDFDIAIASYEIIIREKAAFRKIDWEYITIDEAHRIKNEQSLLSQVLREFTSRNRLLITGTPLQNNLHELWALLNFLLPDIFNSSEDFDEWFSSETTEEDQEKIVKQLHTVLQPFLLRRLKNDVEKSLLPKKELNLYVGMSSMQKRWYKNILEKDLDAVNGANGNKESKTRLLNIVMQLRKCCNHPYLFDGAEPGPPYTTDEHLIYNSEKLKVLDKLLRTVKEQGSRVLIFSQMSRVLDILEDYCFFREYEYCRIDGSTDHEDRIRAIDEYNAPDSKKFIFLLTTRAGGLGINLTTADIVVLFDSDWNPQADLQAMDRAHRIGQKKQVKVFRLVTDNSVEEKIIERATQKLRLDQLVIQQNRASLNKQKKDKGDSKDALLTMIQHGAADVFKNDSETPSAVGTPSLEEQEDDIDLDTLLATSESRTKSLNAKYEALGLDDLQKFNQDSAYEWNGKDFKKQPPKKEVISTTWINPSKRERTHNYSVDGYYKDVLHTGRSSTPSQSKLPRGHLSFSHHFQSPQLRALYQKERLYAARKLNYTPIMDDVKAVFGEYEEKEDDDIKNKKLGLLKVMIMNAQPLSEEEEQLKEELEKEGYPNWNKLEFRKFVAACGKHGKNSLQAIAAELAPGKTYDEVRDFAHTFWSRIEDIKDYERYLRNIENEEEKFRTVKLQQEALRRKLSECKNPLVDLTFKFPPTKTYNELQDRFILIMLFKYGLDRDDVYDLIRDEIRSTPLFELDLHFRNKNSAELHRRGTSLLQCLEKEFNTGIVLNDEVKSRIEKEDIKGKRTREELEKEYLSANSGNSDELRPGKQIKQE